MHNNGVKNKLKVLIYLGKIYFLAYFCLILEQKITRAKISNSLFLLVFFSASLFPLHSQAQENNYNITNYPIISSHKAQQSSLSLVAEKLRPNDSFSIYKITQLLFHLNPSAFHQGNINKLKKGSTLLLPNLVRHELKKKTASFKSTSTPTPTPTPTTVSTTQVFANQVSKTSSDIINFIGQVQVTQEQQQIQSEQASYHISNKLITAKDQVIFNHDDMLIKGETLRYFTELKQGEINKGSYKLPKLKQKEQLEVRGIAEHISFSPDLSLFKEATFSTCPADQEDWLIKASTLTLHSKEEYGEGRNVTFYVKDIPILYTPYIQFPLGDKRRSGLLFPQFNYSSDNGLDLSLPYYWNIDTNMDLTTTPRIMVKRGLLLQNEFRHISRHSQSELSLELINDNRFDMTREASDIARYGTEINEQRGALSIKHKHQLAQQWHASIDFNYLSDNYYLNDFSSEIGASVSNHVNREMVISHQNTFYGGLFKAHARLQQFQLLVSNTNTYSRLPQIQADYTLNLNQPNTENLIPLQLGFNSEIVSFIKNKQTNTLVNEGTRLSLRPYIQLNYDNDYSFVKPRLSLDMLQYNLSSLSSTQASDNQSRLLPIISIDSGLFFERQTSWFNHSYLHTLEPRLYYLYVKNKQQNDFPLFDSALNQFTFEQLFRDNRFTGVDRLGDANQLSAAITTRFVNDEGLESFRASIGQVFYFQDREVQLTQSIALPNSSTNPSSDIAVEVSSEFLTHWNSSLSLLYNPHSSEEQFIDKVSQANFRVQFNQDKEHILNLAYIYQEPSKQVDFSSYWKISENWNILSHINHLLTEGYTSEALLGFEYDSCCYAIRLSASRQKTHAFDKADNRIMLQISFKGLSSVGNNDAAILKSHIPGVNTDF